ncbi:MAG: hypothetical protein HZA81_01930 [Candidatus Taylorbacteria bacterium]|nr:hypothetical protein [Candidatus Taylorbacteria bacterium]
MNIRRNIVLAIILCAIAALVAAIGMNSGTVPVSVVGSPFEERAMPVEDYVRLNISELSPVKESLGGSFFVTSIEARAGAGTVRYEDGHSAYTADFAYSIDERGAIDMRSFEIRE